MLDNILRPLAARWASMFPDTSPLVTNATASISDHLWAGPLLDGKFLENELVSVLHWGAASLLLVAAYALFAAYAVYRARSGKPVEIGGFGPILGVLAIGSVFLLGTAGSYAAVERDAPRVVVITQDGLLEYLGGADGGVRPAQIRSVMICTDCSYVKFELKNGRIVTINAEANKLETLRSAAGRAVSNKPA